MPPDNIARLGIGTVQFGQPYGVGKHDQVPPAEVRTILARAAQAGVPLLDTAANYGSAEAVLAAQDTRPFRIVTKTIRLTGDPDAVLARACQSKRILPQADTLLVHMADDLAGPSGSTLWTALQTLKQEGVFAKIGISAYAAQDPLALARRFHPDVMQLPVSLLDQRLVQDATLQQLKQMGVEIHARSIFLQGLLFLENLPERLRHAVPRLAAVRDRVRAAGVTPLAAALSFVVSQPEIDIALVGVAAPAHLEEILATAQAPMPALDWPALALDDALVLTPSLW